LDGIQPQHLCGQNEGCLVPERDEGAHPPGVHGIKGYPKLTEYGYQLREKQKAKRIYNLMEKQFKNYFQKARKKRGDTGKIFFQFLESRLDNIVYRLGFASSRREARQLVNHNHFLVNNKRVNIPSFQLRKGDIIKIRSRSLKLKPFVDLKEKLKDKEVPGWLSLDLKNLEGKIVDEPSFQEEPLEFDIRAIIEFYSR